MIRSLEASHVAKSFGDKLLFDDLEFDLPPNGIVGVIGANGAGKTTLFQDDNGSGEAHSRHIRNWEYCRARDM